MIFLFYLTFHIYCIDNFTLIFTYSICVLQNKSMHSRHFVWRFYAQLSKKLFIVQSFSLPSEVYLVKTRGQGSDARTGAPLNTIIVVQSLHWYKEENNSTIKINKSALNRILKAYPSYIRVFGLIKKKN